MSTIAHCVGSEVTVAMSSSLVVFLVYPGLNEMQEPCGLLAVFAGPSGSSKYYRGV